MSSGSKSKLKSNHSSMFKTKAGKKAYRLAMKVDRTVRILQRNVESVEAHEKFVKAVMLMNKYEQALDTLLSESNTLAVSKGSN